MPDSVMDTTETTTDFHLRVQWLSADHGLWVATGLSERNSLMHLGRIELDDEHYYAYDRLGSLLGIFSTLGEAKSQLEHTC